MTRGRRSTCVPALRRFDSYRGRNSLFPAVADTKWTTKTLWTMDFRCSLPSPKSPLLTNLRIVSSTPIGYTAVALYHNVFFFFLLLLLFPYSGRLHVDWPTTGNSNKSIFIVVLLSFPFPVGRQSRFLTFGTRRSPGQGPRAFEEQHRHQHQQRGKYISNTNLQPILLRSYTDYRKLPNLFSLWDNISSPRVIKREKSLENPFPSLLLLFFFFFFLAPVL